MTLSQWVAALNGRLKDGANALFTAAEKEAHVEAAIRDYGGFRPRVLGSDLGLSAGVQCYALPDGCLGVREVILPRPAAETLAETGEGDTRLRGWVVVAGELWLFPPPAEDGTARLNHYAPWTVETVPESESETVLLAAHARCCEALATDAARAFAFWTGSEKFDRSAVSEHYAALARELRRQFARRLAMGG